MDAHTQLCTFSLGGLFMGVDVLRVQEVLRPQEMTPVPLAPPVVRGLINLRGQVVTAMDLRRRLGLAERPADAPPPMNVIVRSPEEVVSFLVDEIGDVVEPAEDTFERPPRTLDPAVRDVVSGVYKLDGRLLLVLDATRAMELPAVAQPD